MTPEYQEFVKKLSTKLKDQSIDFLDKNIEEGSNTSPIINLIISSHVTSMFHIMDALASDHIEMKNQVSKFKKVLLDAIVKATPMCSVEVL